MDDEAFLKVVTYYKKLFIKIKEELSQIVVGQQEVMDYLILALVSGGHCLVEGVPGIGKTLMIKAMSRVLGLDYARIQFTPDLLPTDIIGITAYEEDKGFYVVKGPIFANFILADEINRAPPKVQSALLESMQEKQATIGKETFLLPAPFFVMATQNPLENLGTYTLPEAQLDRFLFKLKMTYPKIEEEAKILEQNMTIFKFDDFKIEALLNPKAIKNMQSDVKKIFMDKKVEEYIVKIVDATRNPKNYSLSLAKYIDFGCSPRATIALFISSKASALLNGRTYVTPQDVKTVAHSCLRHRLILNYEGQADDIDVDTIIDEILNKVPIINK
ncbi:ATPase [Candidatus Woesearchaeota archaeon]|nr:MAG: ATPase [Candidatus Woesearchaeota archaeon]